MWWEWTPPPAKLTHCWRCGFWWCGPCPLEPSFPPQTPSLEWTIRGDPMSLIQEFNDLPFRRRALKNICWLGYTHVSSVPAWKKTPHTRRFQSFSCSTFGIEDFCLSMGSGKGWFGAGVWKYTIFVSLQPSGRKVVVRLWLHESILQSSLNLFWVKRHHIAWVKGHRRAGWRAGGGLLENFQIVFENNFFFLES